jgi:hypothetical protein
MTVSLSEEQRRAVESAHGSPIYVVDPGCEERFVLITEASFDRIKALLEADDFDIRETYAAQSAAAGAAGWDDPEMDVYDDYDANRSKS